MIVMYFGTFRGRVPERYLLIGGNQKQMSELVISVDSVFFGFKSSRSGLLQIANGEARTAEFPNQGCLHHLNKGHRKSARMASSDEIPDEISTENSLVQDVSKRWIHLPERNNQQAFKV
jgi:hypothetical protein